MVKLLTLKQAAAALNVPIGSLRRAAEQHGYLIKIGIAVRIREEELPALIEACRVPKQEALQASARGSTSPETIVVKYSKAAQEFDASKSRQKRQRD